MLVRVRVIVLMRWIVFVIFRVGVKMLVRMRMGMREAAVVRVFVLMRVLVGAMRVRMRVV